MGQFLDSAGNTGGGPQSPVDGKKSMMIPSPVTTPVASSLLSAFASGGTRM